MAKNVAMRLARKSKDYTQQSLGEMIGLSELEVSKIECGRSSPTYGLACRIAEALGTDIKTLFPEFN